MHTYEMCCLGIVATTVRTVSVNAKLRQLIKIEAAAEHVAPHSNKATSATKASKKSAS